MSKPLHLFHVCDAEYPDEGGGIFVAHDADEARAQALAALDGEIPEATVEYFRARKFTRDEANECAEATGLRLEVWLFAQLMEHKLWVNRHKGDRSNWTKDSPESLRRRAVEEIDEARAAVQWLDAPGRTSSTTTDVAFESADVANMVMMAADACGALFPELLNEPANG